MKRNAGSEFTYQLFALLIAIIVVHSLYVAWIRPNADAILQYQLDRQASGEAYVVQRSVYVVMRDLEQEACFILMFWAMAIMGYKARLALTERKLLAMPLLRVREGTSILPEDTEEFARPVQALPQEQQSLLIPRAMLAALRRFHSTRNIADASNAVKEMCESEADRLDSELSMVRYIAWAIPSIGFIGTVRGIGEALGQAHKAVEGDIAGVTVSLGVAFNSTFIALVISIVVMFLSHQLQLLQERQVLDSHSYCEDKLLRHLRAA
ncbi:MAG: MotA/TolQ/ExbB proton channel family protein [Gammaproteobacteria bacterium]|uniref:MotA/TolQ/ExbB proton channel family protein n=1 Tax=Pseudomaricurvus alcaniphilus TaxID=1166482 RepID=UPI00140D72BF|nr:MotA/TolQ/ExbB proton channel family protein [Pseudomaricurvus alcaniphilus]MBR9910986.1 MotA/TolQ/ExbB proton channel family protein [Gammaproteobacteria bacterium]NHN37696.1 MotA/TolQ/ExbB proton channel family protein [Pseudomaricurvus alcaniphilus]